MKWANTAMWVMTHIGTIMWTGVAIYLIVYHLGYTGRDDTDSKISRKRSGITLYTDHGTGCQYIKAGMFSPLVPRLDRNGNHVCAERRE